MKLTCLIIAVLASTLGASGKAAAVTQNRIDRQTPVNNCQAALPSFTGFRLRTLGITNESTTSAFLSCSFSTDSSGSPGNSEVDILFTNKGTANGGLTCTVIRGLGSGFGSTTLSPRYSSLAQGQTSRSEPQQATVVGFYSSNPVLVARSR